MKAFHLASQRFTSAGPSARAAAFARLRASAARQRGFTLIELLVVIAIIALLVTILMPSLTSAKELARRSVCGSQLRNMGLMAAEHAADHNGWFPTANRTHVNRMGWIMVWDNDSDPDNDAWTDVMWWSGQQSHYEEYHSAWKVCGTPWETWVEYGMTDTFAICPSGTRVGWTDLSNTGGKVKFNNTWMGKVVGTSYVWVSGTAYKTHGDYRNWGDKPPALMDSDDDLGNRVLACDSVWADPVGSFAPDYRVINHPDRSNAARPDFQNVLYGAGHVLPAGEYPDGAIPRTTGGVYTADYGATSNHPIYWNPPK